MESKKQAYPFAFLATYSTGLDQKSGCKHVPLKHALAEYSNFTNADRALVYVPSHPARELDEDLQAAGIPKVTKDGKMDFAALRNSYVTLAVEAGANVKELQTLARHSTPNLTMNVYAKHRNERLSELAEKIGESVLSEPECAMSVHRKSVEAHTVSPKLLKGNELEGIWGNGGGGIRTRKAA